MDNVESPNTIVETPNTIVETPNKRVETPDTIVETPEANVNPLPAKLVPLLSFKAVNVTAWATENPANEPVMFPDPLNNTAEGFTGIFAIVYFILFLLC